MTIIRPATSWTRGRLLGASAAEFEQLGSESAHLATLDVDHGSGGRYGAPAIQHTLSILSFHPIAKLKATLREGLASGTRARAAQ